MWSALGGKPAYTALSEAFETLDDREKDRAQGNLFAGLASSEYIEEFKQGDFLIRAILGADANSGAVALGAYPRVGQTLQWQVRDRVSADASLREMLLRERGHQPPPFASLVFACVFAAIAVATLAESVTVFAVLSQDETVYSLEPILIFAPETR